VRKSGEVCQVPWKLLRNILAVVLIIVGFLALVTPFTPGSWLIFVGGEMLGIGLLSRDGARTWLEKLKDWWTKRR
jgi:uncharacterized protein YqgC (DUF456 family)